MSGVDNALPDTYGLDHDDLAELLDEARGRYATEHGISESEQADIELMDRAARVPQDRMPLVTALLAVACVVAFVLETRSYGLFPEPVELIDAGGAWSDGGLLALVTANVLHANPIHLLLNLLALAILGTLLEREIGWPRMAVLCVVSGVAGMGLAVVIQPNAVTVGVSGVIFGIAGCAVLRDTHRTRVLGTVAWGMLPIGVIYTFLSPGTSIGAHVGGLIAGLVFGRLWRDADVPEAPPIGAAAAPRPR